MRPESLDAVGAFYSQRARYPLNAVEPGAILVADRADQQESRPGHRACLLWMGVMEDRAVLVSAPELTASVREVVAKIAAPADLMNPAAIANLTAQCGTRAGGGANIRPYLGRKYCCDVEMLSPVRDVNVRKLTWENAPRATRELKSLGIPDDLTYLLAESAAFAYLLDGAPVAFAGTHPAHNMSDSIGDVMVGTLDEHRRRGFGRAVISATTEAVLAQGKVAIWGMSHDNVAAMRTASSIGYQQYCEVLELRCAV